MSRQEFTISGTHFIDCTDVTVNPLPGSYYVSVWDDGRDKFGLLAGPYRAHSEALAALPAAREVAYSVDARAHWYAFGTVKMPDGYSKPGVLNHLIDQEAA